MTDQDKSLADLRLFQGAAAGDAQVMRDALAAGGDPDSYLGHSSLLSLAAMNGARECVELLIGLPDPRHACSTPTPAEWARIFRHDAVAEFIDSYFDSHQERGALSSHIEPRDAVAWRSLAL